MKMPGVIFFFLLLSFSLAGQAENTFRAIDKHARKAPQHLTTDLEALTDYLIQPANDELSRVRSIYSWITNHIDYDSQAYKGGNKRINRSNEDILRRRKAVCQGYANLFQAMCIRAGIPCEVITGYSKGTLTSRPGLEEPDHAWNAVLLHGKWQLLDVTWGSSIIDRTNDFVQTYNSGYFLTVPDLFIVNHLPADPMWQLLDCPITPEQFLASAETIRATVEQSSPCFSFRDSIRAIIALPANDRKIKEAFNTYYFNPTGKNKGQAGHTLLDYAGSLTDEAEKLQSLEQELDRLLLLQRDILRIFEQARRFTDLYDWQKELLVNTQINYAIALSRTIPSPADKDQTLGVYREMLEVLTAAQRLLNDLPDSYFVQHARPQLESILEIVQENIN